MASGITPSSLKLNSCTGYFWTGPKDHWAQVKPEMLSRTFQRLRDDLHLCDFLQPEQRPSFHEIRALGANLYEKAGVNPQRLLGHAEEKMTATYLSRHKIRYLAVSAGLEI